MEGGGDVREIRFVDRAAKPRRFKVGVELDNNVETVRFDLPELDEDQAATLYWRNGEHADAVSLTDGVWTIENTMTQYPGEAECYIVITVGEAQTWHSEVFWAVIPDLPSIEGTVEQVYPSAIQAGVEAAAASAEAAEAAQEAIENGKYVRGDVAVELNSTEQATARGSISAAKLTVSGTKLVVS